MWMHGSYVSYVSRILSYALSAWLMKHGQQNYLQLSLCQSINCNSVSRWSDDRLSQRLSKAIYTAKDNTKNAQLQLFQAFPAYESITDTKILSTDFFRQFSVNSTTCDHNVNNAHATSSVRLSESVENSYPLAEGKTRICQHNYSGYGVSHVLWQRRSHCGTIF